MIETLHISNYALIDTIDIRFNNGFNIITGETGAGKSIILGALSLILGGRADTKVVRNAEAKSVIEATFAVDKYPAIAQFCQDNDIEWHEQCILRREISPNGRSRAFVNDTPVTLAQLQSVAMQLVDIHSQHQNLLLAAPDYQLHIIDSLAANAPLLQQYSQLYRQYVAAVQQLKQARLDVQRSADDQEFIRFQLQQLDQLNPVAGEQEELEQQRELLTNMTQIKQSLYTALQALSQSDSNTVDLLDQAIDSINNSVDSLPQATQLAERLETAQIEIRDIADELQSLDNRLSADPAQLQQIEERLDLIYSLQRRHHVDTVEQLIDLRNLLASQLNALDNSQELLQQLETQARQTQKQALEVAREISSRRRKQADEFSQQLIALASPLGMKNLQCDIQFTPTTQLTPTGIDTIQFLFAFNKNQQPMPVQSTASGGEISRLMLTIKSIIAAHMQLPSIIFDEIDTGVSGDIAHRMGNMMSQIAQSLQVIAITHLPQVAALGTTHFKVYKQDNETSTTTNICHLTTEQRIDEIAVMLSGSAVDPAAIANARSLLNIQ
ncbi:MAG: DNA repair protein RecN [Muribaculaceae bacterium]|nr:DNA repair protein RecN [Muribaculaceae bacterium]